MQKDTVQEILHKIAQNKTIIIVFANKQYSKVLGNWIEAINKLNITNYLVISMDEILHRQLNEMHIPSIERICNVELGDIWNHRIKVINEIIECGYNVVHSDADAIWLKNPMQEYIYNQPYDMIFSQGTYWPKNAHKKFGFVLCCGFFYIKANKATLRFIKQVGLDVLKSNDDQVSCNEYMLKHDFSWEIPGKTYIKSFQGVDFTCSEELIRGKNNEFEIAVLPHSKFQRVQDDEKDVYVKHIISEKNSDSIIDVMKKNNCWFVNELDGKNSL